MVKWLLVLRLIFKFCGIMVSRNVSMLVWIIEYACMYECMFSFLKNETPLSVNVG